MKLSVIIPAFKAERTLPRALESLNAAAKAWSAATGLPSAEAEIVVSWDREGKGPSWARNRGLEKATGDIVFFCDADDTVREDFLLKPYRRLEETGADICLFRYNGFPETADFTLEGNDRVRAAYLPAYFGFSADDVRRWNGGGDLFLLREPGSVCRCAFRRSFVESHAIRFDERLTMYEDAAFLSNCVAFAEKTVSMRDELYRYEQRPDGNMSTGWKSERYWAGKFAMLEFRKRLDAATGGAVWRYCEASCVLTALELLKERRADLPRYLKDDRVRAALGTFPLSWRHPLVAAAVTYLKRRAK